MFQKLPEEDNNPRIIPLKFKISSEINSDPKARSQIWLTSEAIEIAVANSDWIVLDMELDSKLICF